MYIQLFILRVRLIVDLILSRWILSSYLSQEFANSEPKRVEKLFIRALIISRVVWYLGIGFTALVMSINLFASSVFSPSF